MKKWRHLSGILSIVYAVIVLFQSVLVGTYNTFGGGGSASGTVGFGIMLLMVTGGVTSIVLQEGGAGCFATMLIFGYAGWYGYNNLSTAGIFQDLTIWTVWCILCAVVSFIGYVVNAVELRKRVKTSALEADEDEEDGNEE